MSATLDLVMTPRLRAERLSMEHFPLIRRMDQDARFMARLGGVRDEEQSCEYMGFETLGLSTVVAVTLRNHEASRRVMLRAGLRYERDLIFNDLPHVLYRARSASRNQL